MTEEVKLNKGGRPTVMTPEVQTYICTELASGRSVRSICKEETMPAVSTVMLAVVKDIDGFRNMYTRAREAAGYAHADSIIEITEELRNEGIDDRRARVIIDGLKWAAERMAPKAHSPRQEQHHSGSVDVSGMTPEQLAERAQALLRKMNGESDATEEGQQPEDNQQ